MEMDESENRLLETTELGYKIMSYKSRSEHHTQIVRFEEFFMLKVCGKYSVDLSAYFDRELEGDALGEMEAHLEECEACTEGLKKLDRLHNAITSLAQAPTHRRSVLDDLKAKLDLQPKGKSSKTPLPS